LVFGNEQKVALLRIWRQSIIIRSVDFALFYQGQKFSFFTSAEFYLVSIVHNYKITVVSLNARYVLHVDEVRLVDPEKRVGA